MNRLSFILLVVVFLSIPTFADSILGTVSTSFGVHVTTPEGVSLNIPAGNYSGPIVLDPVTGAFSFPLYISTLPSWMDMCGPYHPEHCSGVDFTGRLSGTLSSLPAFNGTWWVIPDQVLTLHGTADIFYIYVDSGGSTIQNTVHGVQTEFFLALTNYVYLDGFATLGHMNLVATFPDPTPEPTTMILALTGVGLLWNKRRRA